MDGSDSPKVSLDIAGKINQLTREKIMTPRVGFGISLTGILSAKIYQLVQGIIAHLLGPDKYSLEYMHLAPYSLARGL